MILPYHHPIFLIFSSPIFQVEGIIVCRATEMNGEINVKEQIINDRYILKEKLGQGGMGTVHRAVDRLTGESIALKQVTIETQFLQFASVSPSADTQSVHYALAQEFRTLASLRHPHVISVLDYGFYENRQPFFTMDYLEGMSDFVEGSFEQSLEEKFELIIQLLQALAYLHRRGVLHRDIKPGNVAVHEDRVKVLDFGLSIDRDQQEDDKNLAGTPAFLAPELLQGEKPSEASDLYAVGVMAYELFTGSHPFEIGNIGRLISQILTAEPDFTEIDALSSSITLQVNESDDEITEDKSENLGDDLTYLESFEEFGEFATDPKTLSHVIRRLLIKSPEDRYHEAYDAIHDFSMAMGQPIPIESATIRDSFLQAARFVGREAEILELQTAMRNALQSHGSAWLIGGETGVGKSRLLDELRIQALIEGMTTIRGQAVSEGSLPYQLWRGPVRRMLLHTEVGDVDASILKDLVHDINRLLERDVQSADTLDADSYQDRLQASILSLFQEPRGPILLLLEDLQWAQDSTDILKRLCNMIKGLPIMIVATYRHDEAPLLAKDLPELNPLRLDRLNEESIARLSVSILGDIGAQSEILTLLERETEGNVYFVVEVVRALAEEAGSLQNIGQSKLPEQIAAGGMQQILQRRLLRAPEYARSLLNLAAIIGRELDQKLLEKLKGKTNLANWLSDCSNAGIIEVNDNQWRFAHDRLRKSILQAIEPGEVANLHAKVATAIEAIYGSQPEQAYVLANHWRAAGDTKKELETAQQAADFALHIGNLADSKSFYERALELIEKVGDEDTTIPETQANVQVNLGRTLNYLGDYEAALQYLEQAEKHFRNSKNQEGTAKTILELGNVIRLQGDYSRAEELTNEALKIYTEIEDKSGMAYAMDRLSYVRLEKGDYDGANEIGEKGLALGQELGDRVAIAGLVNNLGNTAFRQGNYERATAFYKQSEEICRETGERRKVATLLMNLGSVAGQKGDLESCHDYFKQALEVFENIGEKRLIGLTNRNLGLVADMQGDFLMATHYYEESLGIMRSLGSAGEISSTLRNLGQLAVKLEQNSRAMALFRESLQEAHQIEAMPIVLEVITHLSSILPDRLFATQLLGNIIHHSASSQETINKANAVAEEIKASIAEEDYETSFQAGKAAALDDLVKQVLEQLE